MEEHRTLSLPVITTWDEWAAVFTDVELWAGAVRAIAHRASLPVHTIEAGYPGTNAVFVINRPPGVIDAPCFVVKIYAPFCHADYGLERELYPRLARHPALPVPALLDHGILQDVTTWPYLVLTHLPGEPIREVRDAIPRPDLISIAGDLGRRVRVLHSLPTENLDSLDSPAHAWHALGPRYLGRTIEHLRRETTLPPALLDTLPDFVAPYLSPPAPPECVLVSGDLTEDHLLLERRGARWAISGLIDFADALVAPPAYEWAALWFGALGRDADALRAFMAGYDADLRLDTGFYRHALAFTFLHEFGGLMIAQALRELGDPQITTLEQLQAWLWTPGAATYPC